MSTYLYVLYLNKYPLINTGSGVFLKTFLYLPEKTQEATLANKKQIFHFKSFIKPLVKEGNCNKENICWRANIRF